VEISREKKEATKLNNTNTNSNTEREREIFEKKRKGRRISQIQNLLLNHSN
jgi:hypothetical protein